MTFSSLLDFSQRTDSFLLKIFKKKILMETRPTISWYVKWLYLVAHALTSKSHQACNVLSRGFPDKQMT